VTSAHFAEYWVFGVFFVVLGWYQAIWAVLYAVRPRRMLALTALLVNAGTVGLWLWTRTVGVPIGPKAGELEPIGASDVAATIFEVAIVVGLLLSMSVRRPLHRNGEPHEAADLCNTDGSQRRRHEADDKEEARPVPVVATLSHGRCIALADAVGDQRSSASRRTTSCGFSGG
jgi:hypothetical protein